MKKYFNFFREDRNRKKKDTTVSTRSHVNAVTCQRGHMSTRSHVNEVTCQRGHMSTRSHVNEVTCQRGHMSTHRSRTYTRKADNRTYISHSNSEIIRQIDTGFSSFLRTPIALRAAAPADFFSRFNAAPRTQALTIVTQFDSI